MKSNPKGRQFNCDVCQDIFFLAQQVSFEKKNKQFNSTFDEAISECSRSEKIYMMPDEERTVFLMKLLHLKIPY